jgi:hypothetical protein
MTDVVWGMDEPRRTAYVIAEPETFTDGSLLELQRSLGALNFVRVSPVKTNKTCSAGSGDTETRSMLMAHRNAWAAIGMQTERALVLEGDFSVGSLSNEQMIVKMATVFAMDGDDLTHIGWCDECPEDSTKSPCWGCATGYVLHPRLARKLVQAEFCMNPGQALVGACESQDSAYGPTYEWASHYQADVLKLETHAACSFLYEQPIEEGMTHYGIFKRRKKQVLPGQPAT